MRRIIKKLCPNFIKKRVIYLLKKVNQHKRRKRFGNIGSEDSYSYALNPDNIRQDTKSGNIVLYHLTYGLHRGIIHLRG